MITTIRKHQRWLLLLVAILTIIAFAWLYNTTDTEQIGASEVATMYDKTIYQADIDRAIRLYQLAILLGMEDFLSKMTSTSPSQEQALEEFVWNLLILQKEAGSLWVTQTSEQVVEKIRSLPALRSNTGFDRTLYLQFLQEELAPRGLTERHLEDLVRDSLSLDRIATLVSSPAVVGKGEAGELEKMLQPVDLQIVRLGEPKNPPPQTAGQEEVAAFFEENRAALKTPAFRSARFVKISLAPEKTELEGREKVEALQEAANRISELHEILEAGETSLEQAAEEAAAEIGETGWVDSRGMTPGENPIDPGLSADLPPLLLAEVFRLREDRPLGDIVQDGNHFYIPLWQNQRPSRELTLEEAGAKIAEVLVAQKEAQSDQELARQAYEQIRDAVAGGLPLEVAAAASGASVETSQGLEPWSDSSGEKAALIQSSLVLNEGEIGDLQSAGGDFVFALLVKRHAPVDAVVAEQGVGLRNGLRSAKRMLLLAEWLRVCREESGLKFLRGPASDG